MSIQVLQFCVPFFGVKYIEDEERYPVDPESLIFNLSRVSKIIVQGQPIPPLQGRIVRQIEIENIESAILVDNYAKHDGEAGFFDAIRKSWPTLFSISGLSRHKGLPYHRSPETVKLNSDTTIYFCYAAPMMPSGPHKDHVRDYDEIHGQVLGYGKMQKLKKKDPDSVYEEVILAPGNIHDKFCNEDGEYPWHQYYSITDCVYMPIEIDR